MPLFILLTTYILNRAYQQSQQVDIEHTLTTQLYTLIAAAEPGDHGLELPTNELDILFGLPSSGVYAQISEKSGKLIWKSSSIINTALPKLNLLQPGEKKVTINNLSKNEYITLSHGLGWDSDKGERLYTFHVTHNMSPYIQAQQQYQSTLWTWLSIMSVLLMVTLVIILRWGLSPLRKISDEIKQIESGEKNRIDGTFPDELQHLSNNINTLLENENRQKQRYRDALGDLAHSLKTPLAVMKSHSSEVKSDQQQKISEQINQIDTIIEYQLNRAATAGRGSTINRVVIKPVTEKIINALNKVYHDKNLTIVLAVNDNTRFQGDEGDLMELLGNLLDNACKWAKSTITVNIEQTANMLTLSVSDDGHGIDPVLAQKIVQRGQRLDTSVPGHGIGLSIVNTIVESYNGTVSISRSEMNGALIQVRLPV